MSKAITWVFGAVALGLFGCRAIHLGDQFGQAKRHAFARQAGPGAPGHAPLLGPDARSVVEAHHTKPDSSSSSKAPQLLAIPTR